MAKAVKRDECNDGWGDFTPVSEEIPYRSIFRSWGAEKCGKNDFGLTGPGPVAIQSFDVGLEGMVEKFVKGFERNGVTYPPKEIRRTEYEFDKGAFDQKAAQDIIDRFETDYRIALKKARLIQWDTETEFWEVCRYAKFGKKSDAPNHYEELNAWYRDLIQQAYDSNVSLQLIQKVKEKWGTVKKQNKDGRIVDSPYPTGEFEPTGFKEAGYIVQANLKHSFVPATDGEPSKFVVKVINCRQNMAVAGEEFDNLDFPTFGQMVFPESDESDWQ